MREAAVVTDGLEVSAPAPPAPARVLPSPRRAPEGAAGGAVGPALRERPRRRSRGASAVVALLLALALVGALALVAHLWGVSGAWRVQAQEAAVQRDQLASASVELQRHLDDVQAALDASDARVEQLAAEKARAADLREAGDR